MTFGANGGDGERNAFVIMQIGNPDLDGIYETVIAPAVRSAGLVPRRIDQDNEGGLLNAEIMEWIENADIVVADLTNERPNCYLEVGFALGLGRNASLVLTVRQDHLPGHPDYDLSGPKVHFDLAGYDLLLWDPNDLEEFREELSRRIQRRLAISSPRTTDQEEIVDLEWIASLREKGVAEIAQRTAGGYMEVAFGLLPPKLSATQRELVDAAREATISTFGWPIGVFIDKPESRPRPTGSGIHAEVEFDRGDERSFDLWELRTNGDFYTILSLFEDQRHRSDELFFNTRIVRATEALLFCGRLYANLRVDRGARVQMTIRHGGLKGRKLTSSTPSRRLSMEYQSAADESETTLEFVLGELDAGLTDLVRRVTVPLFEMFDFFRLADDVYDDIVDRFVRGEVV